MSNNKHTQLVDFSNINADKIISQSTNQMTNETKQTAVKKALLFTVRIVLLLTVGVICKVLLLMFDNYNAAFKKGWH